MLPPATPPRRSSLAFTLCSSSSSPSSRQSYFQLPPPAIPEERERLNIPHSTVTTPRPQTHSTHRSQTLTTQPSLESFRVYNDRLAPSTQPQAPLDLSRALTLTAPVYTAPPGLPSRVYRNPRVPSGASPVARARQLRGRREREERRERDVTVLVEDGEGVWREEWDVDGIGEENY